jgi:hypothetical protein
MREIYHQGRNMDEVDVEMHERIARIETALGHHIEDEDEVLKAVVRKLDRIELELSRYRGIVGGILLAFTAMTAAVKLFGARVMALFGG